jgi:hypothetical protein
MNFHMSGLITFLLLLGLVRALVSGRGSCFLVTLAIVATTYLAARTAAGDLRDPWFVFSWSPWQLERIEGSGIAATGDRTVGNFSAVDVSGPISADIAVGLIPGVHVVADSNIIGLVRTVVMGHELHVYMDSGRSYSYKVPVHVKITSPQIAEVRSNSAAQVRIAQADGQPLKLRARSGSDIQATGKFTDLQTSAESGSNIHASGSAQSLSASASEGSALDLEDLSAEQAQLSVSSGANAKVIALNSLDIAAREGANVQASGHVQTLKVVASSSSVVKLDQLVAAAAQVDASQASNVQLDVTNSVTGSATAASNITLRGNPRSSQLTKDISSSIH